MTASITCPRCHRTSYNPNDIEHGYCGACHDWTSDVCISPECPFIAEPGTAWCPFHHVQPASRTPSPFSGNNRDNNQPNQGASE